MPFIFAPALRGALGVFARCLPLAAAIGLGAVSAAPAGISGATVARQVKTFDCPRTGPPGARYVTAIFDLNRFLVPTSEDDPGWEFEFQFFLYANVYQRTASGGPGKSLCPEFDAGWSQNLPIPNLKSGAYLDYPLGRRVVLRNLPRSAIVQWTFGVWENDSFDTDYGDVSPRPSDGFLNIYVYLAQRRATYGDAKTPVNLQFGKAKRLFGDGRGSYTVDFVAGLDFTLSVLDQPQVGGAVGGAAGGAAGASRSPNLPSPGQPVPSAADPDTDTCRTYALNAVRLNQQAASLACGFAPPVWSNDHQAHFGWCMRGANVARARKENNKRRAALAQCKLAKAPPPAPAPQPGNAAACGLYAGEALKLAAGATALGCGFGGPRWLQDYRAHYDFCMSGVSPAILLAEATARANDYQICVTLKGG